MTSEAAFAVASVVARAARRCDEPRLEPFRGGGGARRARKTCFGGVGGRGGRPPFALTGSMEPDDEKPRVPLRERFWWVVWAALAVEVPLLMRVVAVLFPSLPEKTPISSRKRVEIPELSDSCRAQLAQMFPDDLDKSSIQPSAKRDRRIAKLVDRTYCLLLEFVDEIDELRSRPSPALRVTVDHTQLTYAKYSVHWPEGREIIDFVIGIDYLPAQAPFLLAHELGHTIAQHTHSLLGAHRRWEKALDGLTAKGLSRGLAQLISKASAAPNTLERVPKVEGTLGGIYTSLQRRQNEYEADQIGGILYSRAGFTPVSYIRSLAWVGSRVKDDGSLFFRTHPPVTRRLRRMLTIQGEMIDCYEPTTQSRELAKLLAEKAD